MPVVMDGRMSGLIGIEVNGVPQVVRMLEQLRAPAVTRAVSFEVADYLRGQLRKYPAPTYVSRTRAYGKPFQTVKQRRWFFAALRSGALQLPYVRSGRLRAGWQILTSGQTDHLLLNDVDYATYVQNSPQARMMTLRQWRSIQTIIYAEATRLQRVTDEALNRALKKIRG